MVTHFDQLDSVYNFLKTPGARAVGFFSDSNTVESQVFLTVAKQLAKTAELAPAFGRANIGRGTEGCSIYIMPEFVAKWEHNGSTSLPLIVHQFKLPQDFNDPLIKTQWLELQEPTSPEASPPPLPDSKQMFQDILERKSIEVDQLLRESSLPPVVPLNEKTINSITSAADGFGLLVFPDSYDVQQRRYHLNRLNKLAEKYPQRTCASGATFDSMVGRPQCDGVPKFINRFAYTNSTMKVICAPPLSTRIRQMRAAGARRTCRPAYPRRTLRPTLPPKSHSAFPEQMAALLTNALGVPPATLLAGKDPGFKEPTFQVIVRQPDKDGRIYYLNGGDARGRWKAHAMPTKLSWKAASGFANTHMRVDRGF